MSDETDLKPASAEVTGTASKQEEAAASPKPGPASASAGLKSGSESSVSGTPEPKSGSGLSVSGTPEPESGSELQVSGTPESLPNTPDLDPPPNGKEYAKGTPVEDEDKSVVTASNVSEAEDQQKKLPYPKSVFFIISNEFCERFTYYGMRTVLVLYLSHQLNYSDDTATVIFHVFTMFVYFLCILGAIISDSWLGKFKTILYLSLVYVCGSVILTLGAIGPLNLPKVTFTMIGLALIALGSGGIKPCVSAFGGDQFKIPEQVKQMTTYFSLFYFSINAGSLISTSVTPILREDVHCFGEKECYSLAFGVPAVLMCVSILIFVLGRPLYNSKPPSGNMVVLVSKTIWCAITTKCKEKKTQPREHWLDYADKKYDRQLIEDVKVLTRVLCLYLPLPVFWALFDQQGSRWTFQAARMDGNMGSWDIKPDQLQVLNPLLILLFIPLYDMAIYPALRLVGIVRPLQKLTLGGILAGIAFIISGVVELKLEDTYPIIPHAGFFQLRIYSADPYCAYNVTINLGKFHSDVLVSNVDYYEQKFGETENGTFDLIFSMEPIGEDCILIGYGRNIFQEGTEYALFLRPAQQNWFHWYVDRVQKSTKGKPLVRTMANIPEKYRIIWREAKTNITGYEEFANMSELHELSPTDYKVFVKDTSKRQGEELVHETTLLSGGIYSLVIDKNRKSTMSQMFEITPPNSISILWLIPQYVFMTLAEVMFSVTCLQFSHSQVPDNMSSVLQVWWLLTMAFGNAIVIIVAELKFFDSQAYEFFLFAGLMFADIFIFMWVYINFVPTTVFQIQCNKSLEDVHDPNERFSICSISVGSLVEGVMTTSL